MPVYTGPALLIPALDKLLDGLGLSWLTVLLNILLVFLAAHGCTRLTRRIVRRVTQGRVRRLAQDDTAARRVETAASLFEGIAKYVFYFIAAAIAVGELGLTSAMASMLAAAGIGSLAVGIGAQSLIGDIAAGFFMLFDDQVSVGDYVTVAGVTGTVEEITLRTITIRGFRGEKNIIPNGQIQTITNYSRSGYLAVVDLAISQESDADKALDILYQACCEVYEELVAAGDTDVQPPDRIGITMVQDTGVTLRVTMQATVQQQWHITRETIRRARIRFAAAGIRTPHTTTLLREESHADTL